jgi:CheY-like chemotaxis protein
MASERKRRQSIKAGTMKSVLVVDDDILIQRLLREELEEDGYAVSTVSNGREALSALKDGFHKPDVVILDLRMPSMDGLETMGHILKLRYELPVIIFSAYTSYRDDPLGRSADAYVVKSSDFSELKKKVQELGRKVQ